MAMFAGSLYSLDRYICLFPTHLNCYGVILVYGFDPCFSNVLGSRLFAGDRSSVIGRNSRSPFHLWLAYRGLYKSPRVLNKSCHRRV